MQRYIIPLLFLKINYNLTIMICTTKVVNEPSFVEECVFKLGLLIKIKYSSLAWDKFKNNVWTQACENVKKFELSLAWLD